MASDLAAQLPDDDRGGQQLDYRIQAKPTRAIEAATSPAVIATSASATIQVIVPYSS
jgi:hypothetical protein